MTKRVIVARNLTTRIFPITEEILKYLVADFSKP
jgi:hypothetical protein